MWSSHSHTEVQTMEWKTIQEEEVTIFHEFEHKLEEVMHSSHDNFVITIHEASEVKQVEETKHRIEQETVIFKEFTEKIEAIDIKFKETIMKEVVTVEEKE